MTIYLFLFYKTKKIEYFNKIFIVSNIKNKDQCKVKFITLTNDGYIDYTLNCLKSLDTVVFVAPRKRQIYHTPTLVPNSLGLPGASVFCAQAWWFVDPGLRSVAGVVLSWIQVPEAWQEW